ncbi:MAG TPA: hypothetical protein VFQ92_24015 [Blastocatellia bacterium]|nr:hypothetical protein [Blastocatellia bacterium]
MRSIVNTLNDLLSSFSRKNDLIQMLQDSFTPEERRRQIREMLRVQQISVSESREEMARLREKSNLLIKRAVNLVSRAQRMIDKQAHKFTGYAIETCGMCKGLRYREGAACFACKGEGTVLVRQPAQECIRCQGNGVETSAAMTISRVCVICSGTGWNMAVNRA